jgi:hypothetical protein
MVLGEVIKTPQAAATISSTFGGITFSNLYSMLGRGKHCTQGSIWSATLNVLKSPHTLSLTLLLSAAGLTIGAILGMVIGSLRLLPLVIVFPVMTLVGIATGFILGVRLFGGRDSK